MKVSIIIAVYKDIDALELVLTSLKNQTYKNFEVVVVEDGSNKEIKEFLRSIDDLDIKHTAQEDLGVRKARSQNNGVISSSGEYLIFIDGDCILYTTFIEGHVELAESGYVLSGRRLNLNQALTQKLRNRDITALDIQKNLFFKYISLAFDKTTRFEQGIAIDPKGFLYNHFIKNAERNTSILGCNFSCFKDDMLAINGFDESYAESAVSDDMDLDWRFRAYGLRLKSCKNVANMFHLYHQAHDRGDASAQVALMKERELKGLYLCDKGINTH